MRNSAITLMFFLSIGMLISCSSNVKNEEKLSDSAVSDTQPSAPAIAAAVNKDSLLLALTKQVLVSIKANEPTHFADFIYPKAGLRFSPYAHIDTAKDIKLCKEEFLAEFSGSKKYTWGNYVGSGEPISLSIHDYFKKFVYNADFLNAEKTSINKIAGKRNSANNLELVYEGCDYTESYFSGFDKKYEGMDWCALRLVFKNYDGKYYLVGIVHDQWTI